MHQPQHKPYKERDRERQRERERERERENKRKQNQQAYDSAFHDKLESVQHNASLVITDAGELQQKNYTKNQAQNLLNPGVGSENFVIFIRYSMKIPLVFIYFETFCWLSKSFNTSEKNRDYQ